MATEAIEAQVVQEKPKRQRKQKLEIVPLPAPAALRLGMLEVQNPKEMISRASELATALADIIHRQKDSDGKPTMYVIIQGRKYVKAEGWATLGSMLGVVPIEESCEPLPEGKGYKAKIKLIRLNDGMQVGGASAICYLQEKGWNNPDAFSTYSKAITRATGKAFRLSFAWIMKLAGFEPTPADEVFEVEGSAEDADDVAKAKLEEHLGRKFDTLAEAEAAMDAAKEEKKAERKIAKTSAFITWPEVHNGYKFLLSGRTAILEHFVPPDKTPLRKVVEEVCGGKWNDRDNGWYVSKEYAPFIRTACKESGCPLVENDLTGLLQDSLEKGAK